MAGKTISLEPNPLKREAKPDRASSTASEISLESGDTCVSDRSLKKTKLQWRRKRLSVLLHTHIVLILVCIFSTLDAACVIGQLICDVLIMKGKIDDINEMDSNLTSLLRKELPSIRNIPADDLPEKLDLKEITSILWANQLAASSANHTVVPVNASESEKRSRSRRAKTRNLAATSQTGYREQVLWEIPKSAPLSQRKRAAAAEAAGEENGLLYDLTDYFHLGSIIILSALLLESFLKIFAMGKKLLHHKLELFDIMVVVLAWSLDVGFSHGIWESSESATLLAIMLPWRVVRIVNSFVLVMQEKDHVHLKVVKQMLRSSIKKNQRIMTIVSTCKEEIKELRNLCKTRGATEAELNACIGEAHQRKRRGLRPRRSTPSLCPSAPEISADSSSDGDDDQPSRRHQHEPSLHSGFSFTNAVMEESNGQGEQEVVSSLSQGLDSPGSEARLATGEELVRN